MIRSNVTITMCQCPLSRATHFYGKSTKDTNYAGHVCQCPLSRATHFYPTPLRASVYEDFNACFFMYFSELSDFWVQQGRKVGRVQIVF